MNESELHLSDRMASVASRRSAWSADEARHLAECEECRIEFALLRESRMLGDGAPRIDATALAAAVLPKVKAARAQDRRVRWTGWGSLVLAAAAGLAIVFMPRTPGPAETAPRPAALAIAELEGLDSDALKSVLAEVEKGLPAVESPEPKGLGDLDAKELKTVLDGLEG